MFHSKTSCTKPWHLCIKQDFRITLIFHEHHAPLGASGSFSFLGGFPLTFLAAFSAAAAAEDAALAAAAAALLALFLLSKRAMARRMFNVARLGATEASDVLFCKDWVDVDRFCCFWRRKLGNK